MEISLLCSDENRSYYSGRLIENNIRISDNAELTIAENTVVREREGVFIVFDYKNFPRLLQLLDDIKDSLEEQKNTDIIAVKQKDGFGILKVEEVDYFEADGDTVYCHSDNSKYEINKRLYRVENELSNKGFIRINKSTVINIMAVNEIIPWFGGRLLLRIQNSKDELEVSKFYVKPFRRMLGL